MDKIQVNIRTIGQDLILLKPVTATKTSDAIEDINGQKTSNKSFTCFQVIAIGESSYDRNELDITEGDYVMISANASQISENGIHENAFVYEKMLEHIELIYNDEVIGLYRMVQPREITFVYGNIELPDGYEWA